MKPSNSKSIVGLTYSSKNIIAYNNETGYGWEDGVMNDDFEMRYYDVQRERYGLSYAIDSWVTDVTRVYANVQQHDDAETRYKDEYGKIKLDEVLENGMDLAESDMMLKVDVDLKLGL